MYFLFYSIIKIILKRVTDSLISYAMRPLLTIVVPTLLRFVLTIDVLASIHHFSLHPSARCLLPLLLMIVILTPKCPLFFPSSSDDCRPPTPKCPLSLSLSICRPSSALSCPNILFFFLISKQKKKKKKKKHKKKKRRVSFIIIQYWISY